MTGFRLVEYGGGGRGPVTLPRLYTSILEAVEVAERIMLDLENRPHRRPFRVDVYDVWTRETVTSVRLDVNRDPDVCVACGQPADPFGPPLQLGEPEGGRPPPPAVERPPDTVPSAGDTPGEAARVGTGKPRQHLPAAEADPCLPGTADAS